MKKFLALVLFLLVSLFTFATSAQASSPITVTHIEDLSYPEPTQYRFEVYFTPKISTFMPEGNYFSICSFIYDYSNFNRFSSVGWNNDASDTESSCTFLENRNAVAGIDDVYNGKLNIYDNTSSGVFNPIGESNFLDITIPGKFNNPPTIPFLNISSGINILEGGSLYGSAGIVDNDSSSWEGTIDYGDGGDPEPIVFTNKNFAFSHVYAEYGEYTMTISVTDNQGATGTRTQVVHVEYYTQHTVWLTGNSIGVSNNVTNPAALLVQNEDEYATINSDDASISILLNNAIAPSNKNIYQLRIPFYYRQEDSRPDTKCYLTAHTDQGDFFATDCNFESAGFSDGSMNVIFTTNGIHEVYSVDIQIISSTGESTPLEIDYMEFEIGYSNNNIADISTGGPYEVASGQTVQMTASSVDVENNPVEYGWDLDNDGSYDAFTPEVTFSAVDLMPGVYPVKMYAIESNPRYGSYHEYTTEVTVVEGGPTTTILTPIADTFIKKGSPNENEGSSNMLRIQSSGNNRALVKFDTAQIQSAIGASQNYTAVIEFTISDNGNNWGSSGRPIGIHRFTSDWVEGNGYIVGNNPTDRGTGDGATWTCGIDSNISNQTDNCSGNDAWNMTNSAFWPFVSSPTATTTITNNQAGVVSFDVTADVQSVVSGSTQDYGWIVKKVQEGQNGNVEFGSKESASTPRLVLTVN